MKKLMILAFTFLVSTGAFAQKMESKMNNKMDNKTPMPKDAIMMKDGKMIVMKGGQTMMMEKEMTLGNGTMVMTDGTIKMKNGKTMKMTEGQSMSMSGKMNKMGKMKKPMESKM